MSGLCQAPAIESEKGMDQNLTIVAEFLRFSEVYPNLHGSVPLDSSLK
jgi:hypothetical protein